MEVGKLYHINKFHWMLYPSRDIVIAAPWLAVLAAWDDPAHAADYWSKQLNCNVSYIAKNSMFVLLERDGEYCKVLTANGELGWIYLGDWCKDDIKEVNQ